MRKISCIIMIALLIQPQSLPAQNRPNLDSVQSGDDLPLADSTPFFSVSMRPGARPPSNLCYFRLNVQPVDQTGSGEQIGHPVRSGIRRFFNGVDYTFNSVIKVNVSNYEESVVLYSRRYRSTRSEGESHDRSILFHGSDFPLFLLSRDINGSATISFAADMKNSQTFQLAGTALEAVTLGLRAVAPSAEVITTLTEQSTRDVAGQIDQSAGAFMGVSGANAERHDVDVMSGSILRVSIFGPRHEVNENSRDFMLGQWDISFVPTYGSYFLKSDCVANFEDLAWRDRSQAGMVLSAPLIRNVGQVGSLGSYLRQLEWWGTGLSQLNGKRAGSDEVESFCRNIVGAVEALGFNPVDSHIVADAVSRSGLVRSSEGAAMRASPSCNFVRRSP